MRRCARQNPECLLPAAYCLLPAWHTAWLKGWISISFWQGEHDENAFAGFALWAENAVEAARLHTHRGADAGARYRCQYDDLQLRQCDSAASAAFQECRSTGGSHLLQYGALLGRLQHHLCRLSGLEE